MATATAQIASAFNGRVVFTYTYDTSTGDVSQISCTNTLGVPVWAEIRQSNRVANQTIPAGGGTMSLPGNLGARVTDFVNVTGNFTITTRMPA